jgi:hypothetical protein
MSNKKGQVARNVVYFIVAFIVLIAVAIPITQQVVATANLTGITATVVTYIPVFLALAGLILAVMVSGVKM